MPQNMLNKKPPLIQVVLNEITFVMKHKMNAINDVIEKNLMNFKFSFNAIYPPMDNLSTDFDGDQYLS